MTGAALGGQTTLNSFFAKIAKEEDDGEDDDDDDNDDDEEEGDEGDEDDDDDDEENLATAATSLATSSSSSTAEPLSYILQSTMTNSSSALPSLGAISLSDHHFAATSTTPSSGPSSTTTTSSSSSSSSSQDEDTSAPPPPKSLTLEEKEKSSRRKSQRIQRKHQHQGAEDDDEGDDDDDEEEEGDEEDGPNYDLIAYAKAVAYFFVHDFSESSRAHKLQPGYLFPYGECLDDDAYPRELRKFNCTPAAVLLSGATLRIHRPHLTHAAFFKRSHQEESGLRCYECGGPTQGKGFSEDLRFERGLDTIVVHYVSKYRCPKCTNGHERTMNLFHPKVFASLPVIVKNSLGAARVSPKSLIGSNAGVLAVSLVEMGVSPHVIERGVKALRAHQQGRAEEVRMEATRLRHSPHFSGAGAPPLSVSCFDTSLDGLVLTSRLTKLHIRESTTESSGMYDAWLVRAAKDALSLAIDQFFPFRTGNDDGMVCVLTCFNRFNEVVGSWAMPSKSLSELRPRFEDLAKMATVRVVYTDNPKQDERFLKSVFGPAVVVRKDTFHIFQEYYRACRSHPLRAKFMGQLSACFFNLDVEDVTRVERRFVEEGMSEADAAAKVKDFRTCYALKSVRHHLKPAAEIIANLNRVVDEFSLTGLFNGNIIKSHANIKLTVEKYVSDAPVDGVAPVLNTGTVEEPHYIYCLGTGVLENFHWWVRRSIHSCLSLLNAHALFLRLLFVYSHHARVDRRGMRLVRDLTDVILLDRLARARERLRALGLWGFPTRGHALDDYPVLEPVSRPELASGLTIYHSESSVTKALKVLLPTGGSEDKILAIETALRPLTHPDGSRGAVAKNELELNAKAAPVSPEEQPLFRAVLKSGMYFKGKASEEFAANPRVLPSTFLEHARGAKLHKSIDCHRFAIFYNSLLLGSAMARVLDDSDEGDSDGALDGTSESGEEAAKPGGGLNQGDPNDGGLLGRERAEEPGDL